MPELPDSGRPDGDRVATELLALREAAEMAFAPPPIERFRAAARRRTRRRSGFIAVALAALLGLGGGTLALADRGPDSTPRPAPTAIGPSPSAPSASVEAPSPSGSASASPSLHQAPNIRTMDWHHTTIVLPANPDDPDCPAGRITTNGERTTVGAKRFYIGPVLAHGDLTGDGLTDAVVYTHCETTSEYDSGDGSGQLLVITWRDGTWAGLGYVGPRGQNYPAARISGQRLTATVDERYGDAMQDRTYRWDGRRFVQVGGPTVFPSPSG